MSNKEIRRLAASNGVKHWQIAEALGISASWFCTLMRKEFTPEKKKQIAQIINELSQEAN